MEFVSISVNHKVAVSVGRMNSMGPEILQPWVVKDEQLIREPQPTAYPPHILFYLALEQNTKTVRATKRKTGDLKVIRVLKIKGYSSALERTLFVSINLKT